MALAEIGDFHVDLLEEIGRGAYGVIYKATNNQGNLVAAKLITKQHGGNKGIEQDLHLYKNLNDHVNIITIFQVFHHQEMGTWIFTQFAKNGDLEKYFKTNFEQVQDTNGKVILMRQICEGVSFMHSQNIVHHDIKPANILVTNGQNIFYAVVKICDLGLAVHLDPNIGTSGMSTDIGTPNFKAPEFWKAAATGQTKYKRSVDIFSTGLTFLAMLQSKKGANLKPVINDLPVHERGKPIGEIMFSRQIQNQPRLNLVLHVNADDYVTEQVKGLTDRMTSVVPEERPLALECYQLLNNMLQVSLSKMNNEMLSVV